MRTCRTNVRGREGDEEEIVPPMHIEWNKVTWYSKLAAVIIFVATFFIGFYLGRQYESARVAATSAEKDVQSIQAGTPIKLYFYDPQLDQGPGGAECSRNGLVAVPRILPATATPLRDSIALLLRGGLSDVERARGITTEFPLPGVALKSAVIKDGVATLTFADPQNKTSGGSCRAGVLWFQIEATAKQFPTVTSVRFMPEDIFQP